MKVELAVDDLGGHVLGCGENVFVRGASANGGVAHDASTLRYVDAAEGVRLARGRTVLLILDAESSARVYRRREPAATALRLV
jgi:hypothetical protein